MQSIRPSRPASGERREASTGEPDAVLGIGAPDADHDPGALRPFPRRLRGDPTPMHRPILRIAAAASLAVGVLAASVEVGRASTAQVTVDGVTYNLSSFGGSYADNTEKFNVTTMPWWGDGNLAQKVATAQRVASSDIDTVSGGSDLYAYGVTDKNVSTYYTNNNSSAVFSESFGQTDGWAYITATTVSDVPEIDGGSAARLAFLFGFGLLALKARRDRAAAEG